MCSVKSDSEVMVCDVSRDRVRGLLLKRLGEAAHFEIIHGEGTRFTCADPGRVSEFQASVGEALGWGTDGFGAG
jgi:hypothetical protein